MVCSVLLVSFCWGKLEFRPCVIVGVQKLVCFVSARLAEKFLIQLDDIRVLMALADRKARSRPHCKAPWHALLLG